jgi:transposase
MPDPERTPMREVAVRLRDEEGWSNKAIARHLGVHPSTVGRWFARPELSTRDEQETP